MAGFDGTAYELRHGRDFGGSLRLIRSGVWFGRSADRSRENVKQGQMRDGERGLFDLCHKGHGEINPRARRKTHPEQRELCVVGARDGDFFLGFAVGVAAGRVTAVSSLSGLEIERETQRGLDLLHLRRRQSTQPTD